MKKLIVLVILVVVVLAGVWIGCRCAPLVSPTPVEEPTSVIEPTPTEKIEEPTPVPPTPTPVPPTPTPEPTATPTPTPIPVLEYVGLPPAEVERLREKCLQEHPDSLCLPLPVDPTQPGVEIFFVEESYQDFGGVYSGLGIKAPVGTVFYAPFAGKYQLSFWCDPDCDESSGWPMLGNDPLELHYDLAESSKLTAADFSDPVLWDRLIHPWFGNEWRGIDLALGDVHFTLKTDDLLAKPMYPGGAWVGDPEFQVYIRIFDYTTSPNSRYWLTEDDLLRDEQGRIVYVKP